MTFLGHVEPFILRLIVLTRKRYLVLFCFLLFSSPDHWNAKRISSLSFLVSFTPRLNLLRV